MTLKHFIIRGLSTLFLSIGLITFALFWMVGNAWAVSYGDSDYTAAQEDRNSLADTTHDPSADQINAMNAHGTLGTLGKTESSSPSWSESSIAAWSIADPNFTMEAGSFSPSSKIWKSGKGNVATLITASVSLLMIAIATVAVLLIAVGGLLLATSAGSDTRVSKWKAIITFNLQALGISLSSYLIIKFITWIIGA